jgi:hypothetical protein
MSPPRRPGKGWQSHMAFQCDAHFYDAGVPGSRIGSSRIKSGGVRDDNRNASTQSYVIALLGKGCAQRGRDTRDTAYQGLVSVLAGACQTRISLTVFVPSVKSVL